MKPSKAQKSKRHDLQSKMDTLTTPRFQHFPKEMLQHTTRDLPMSTISSLKLTSRSLRGKLPPWERCSGPVNDWCLAKGKRGDTHWEYNITQKCWQCKYMDKNEIKEFLDALNVHGKYSTSLVMGNYTVGKTLDLRRKQIESLPNDVFRDFKAAIPGHLWLDRNRLTTLPESFGSLKVGGNLYLSSNKMTRLPESFGSLSVGGDLRLSKNQLTRLPASFGSLTVGGSLLLYRNQLTALPDSFGSLTVDGTLDLSANRLTALPESVGSLTVDGDLWLDRNHLTALPESFGSLTVGGDLWLCHNQLTTLPESFGSLKVGGRVCLTNAFQLDEHRVDIIRLSREWNDEFRKKLLF